MLWLTRIAIKKPWLTYLFTALLAGACLWGTLTLKQELFPDIELPMTTVITIYPQAQSETVMNEVTVPIEAALSNIKGLKHLTSTSQIGSSVVLVEFDYGTDMEKINAIIRENVGEVVFPEAVENVSLQIPGIEENPQIVPINMNSVAVVTMGIAGDVPLEQLTTIASSLVLEFKSIDGVVDVSVSGGNIDKVIVNPDVAKLGEAGLSVSQVMGILTSRPFASLDDIQNFRSTPTGPRVQDLASVSIGPEPDASINRTNGKPSVGLAITKTAEANTVKVAAAIIARADELRRTLPPGVDLIVVTDQSTYIKDSVTNLSRDAFLGGGLAILVVFFFLMAVRASLITAISIPMSVLIGFLIMRFTNLTVNILTLSAMTLAIGRVIDDSIVMVEVTFRRMQSGERFPQATLNGAGEIVKAITSATVTMIVIFVPLVLVGGIIGEMFVPFALTITFTMVGSLFTALTIVPALTKLLGTNTKSIRIPKVPLYQKMYSLVLKWCLARRRTALAIAVIIFVAGFGLLPVIGTSFLPDMNTSILNIQIQAPEGATSESLMETVAGIEDVLNESDDVKVYSSSIGSGGMTLARIFGGGEENSALITVSVTPGVRTKDALNRLKESITRVPTSAIVDVNSVSAMSAGSSSIDLTVNGETLEQIRDVADALAAQISTIDGVAPPEVVVGKSQVQVIITPDPVKLAAAGLLDRVTELQNEFYLLQNGGTVGNLTVNGKTYGLYSQSILPQLDDSSVLPTLLVGGIEPVKIADIADIQLISLPTQLSRIDQKLAATVNAKITIKNVGNVNREVEKIINEMNLPEGVRITSGGVFEDMKDSFSKMYISILVAVVLSFFVLLFTFRSLKKSMIIMASLPFAAVGAFVGLLITGHTLGVVGLMGILMLVGIVLTNAVVLLAYTDQLKIQGMNLKEAVIKGGETRLRPILMTALTTLIAMVPMALGLGEGLIVASELAIVVIGGLFSSTLLTLIVVPVVYALVYDGAPKKVK